MNPFDRTVLGVAKFVDALFIRVYGYAWLAHACLRMAMRRDVHGPDDWVWMTEGDC